MLWKESQLYNIKVTQVLWSLLRYIAQLDTVSLVFPRDSDLKANWKPNEYLSDFIQLYFLIFSLLCFGNNEWDELQKATLKFFVTIEQKFLRLDQTYS